MEAEARSFSKDSEVGLSDHGDGHFEQIGLLPSTEHRRDDRRVSKWYPAAKMLTICNICITIFLVFVSRAYWKQYTCVPGPVPPWSPLRDDGVIRNINRMYKPEKIFQSPTSDEVEAAWEDWLEEYDHLLILPKEQTASRLPVTIDAFLDPGYAVYGLAVYHQMHCLNHIRQAFYGDRFFPNVSADKVEFHKNHCFDMLRQSIMCHGDIAMMHWWNDSYSYVDDRGVFRLTEHYWSLTPSQRAEGTFAKWDAAVQCRDLDAIHAWAKAHAMEDDKYIATVGQL